MSRDAVSEEVHHQDSAGDKQHPSLSVNVITLSALDIAGDRPRQVGDSLHSQLLREILLRKKDEQGIMLIKCSPVIYCYFK